MRRRQFLASAAGSLGVAAGCLGPAESTPTGARLHAVWLLNEREDPWDAAVTVADGDGETVYEASLRLGAAGGDGPPSNVSREPALAGPGAYVVTATAGDETATVDATEWASGSERCVTAKFVRTTRGTLRAVPSTHETC